LALMLAGLVEIVASGSSSLLMVPSGFLRKPWMTPLAVPYMPTMVPEALIASGVVSIEPRGSNAVNVPSASRT